MKLRNAFVFAALIASSVAVATCGDSPTGNSKSQAGWLAVNMTTPASDDGGIMFVVGGGTVDSARSSYPNVLTRSESATSFRVIVGGNLAGGKIAELWVPDVRKAAQYTATTVEVATRGTFAQRAVTGYTLTVVRAP